MLRDGILLLDKPIGISSNQALRKAQRALGADKAGHTGTLDPLATGMLPMCFGEATKLAPYLLDRKKCYSATIRLGTRTSTGDAEGEVVESLKVPALNLDALRGSVRALLGPSLQTPPMYSALKKDGVPLYRLARRGETVEREPRPIEVYAAELEGFTTDAVCLRLTVSKGTYIRELAERFARLIGTAGHLSQLRRDWVDPFTTGSMVRLDALLAGTVDIAAANVTAAQALSELPFICGDETLTRRMGQGLPTRIAAEVAPGLCRIGAHEQRTDALAVLGSDSVLRAARVFNRPV